MFIEIDDKSSILIIDPNPQLRDDLDQLLNGSRQATATEAPEMLNFIIRGCSDCQTALAMASEAQENDMAYKLVFVETQLADGDGLLLVQQLWQHDPDLQVVICTDDQTLTWQRIMDMLGQSDQLLILQKPYSGLAARQIVHAMIRKWQLGKQSQNVMQFMEHQINDRTAKIEETNKNLLQAEKMAAIGQLAAGIAHEINTPAQYVGDNIRAIGDFFGSLKRLAAFYQTILKKSVDHTGLQSIQSMEEQEELDFILEDAPLAIAQSLEGITQISQIVQAMKGFAHIGHNRLSSADINKSLQNTLLVAKNSYKYIADVETHFGALPAIECYPAELNQVFLNIIVNAAHAIEEKNCGQGLITITTQSVNDEIEIRIDDNGIGIPEDIRNRIFDPFFTTKDVGKGSGQGLNIAYRIVCEQHHGQLTVESKIGVGSTFMIRLPVTFTE